MPTPKLDAIITEFAKRIGDNASFTGTVLQDGNILTALEMTSYVNKALGSLINDSWALVNGQDANNAVKNFLQLFPDLAETKDLTVVLTGDDSDFYALANPALDLFFPVGAIKSTTYVKVYPSSLYTLLKADRHPITPTTANPVLVLYAKRIYFFPIGFIHNDDVFTLDYIKLPLNPTTGDLLTQNGTYDSPFLPNRNSKIVEIAENLYRSDRQKGAIK